MLTLEAKEWLAQVTKQVVKKSSCESLEIYIFVLCRICTGQKHIAVLPSYVQVPRDGWAERVHQNIGAAYGLWLDNLYIC